MLQCRELVVLTKPALELIQTIPVGPDRNWWQIGVEGLFSIENLVERAAG